MVAMLASKNGGVAAIGREELESASINPVTSHDWWCAEWNPKATPSRVPILTLAKGQGEGVRRWISKLLHDWPECLFVDQVTELHLVQNQTFTITTRRKVRRLLVDNGATDIALDG
jgi:hypothetical protein